MNPNDLKQKQALEIIDLLEQDGQIDKATAKTMMNSIYGVGNNTNSWAAAAQTLASKLDEQRDRERMYRQVLDQLPDKYARLYEALRSLGYNHVETSTQKSSATLTLITTYIFKKLGNSVIDSITLLDNTDSARKYRNGNMDRFYEDELKILDDIGAILGYEYSYGRLKQSVEDWFWSGDTDER